jgi:hypothetical protein
MGLAGLGFWIAGWWVFAEGDAARWAVRCAGQEMAPDCFRDGLPVLEMILPWIGLLLAYFVARFTFTMWAPEPEGRRFYWWPASRRGGGGALWPFGQLLLAVGVVSSLWTLSTVPFVAALLPFHLFWGASALWCTLTLWASWPSREDIAI